MYYFIAYSDNNPVLNFGKASNYFENHRQATRALVTLFKKSTLEFVVNKKINDYWSELVDNDGSFADDNEQENGVDFYVKILTKYRFDRERAGLGIDYSKGSYYDMIYSSITRLLTAEVEKNWEFVSFQNGETYKIAQSDEPYNNGNLAIDFGGKNESR